MPKLKFKASPTPEQAEAIRAAADRLRKFISETEDAENSANALSQRITALKSEESVVAAKIATAGREESRAIAIELAAVRIELGESERQQSENSKLMEAAPKSLRDLLRDAGGAMQAACRNFHEAAKEEFARATAPYFAHRSTALQMGNQTDLFRAISLFMASFSNLPSGLDDGLDRAAQFVEIADRILGNRPAFEWEPLTSPAAA